jgi:von Willebrand factor type A domain
MNINFKTELPGGNMKKIFIIILITFSFTLFAQNKKLYDINRQIFQSSQNGMLKVTSSPDEVSSQALSFTMLPDGYFTVGTNSGLPNSTLDDNCDITFGHPYAKTSYPVFSIDNKLYKLDDYFISSELSFSRNGDTLEIKGVKTSKVEITFSMLMESSGNGVILKQKIKNLDSVDHIFGLGFTFDPALGKWGDGYLEQGSGYLAESKNFISPEIPSNLILWEKSKGAKGIGIDINYPNEKPFKIIAANWKDLFNENLSALDSTQTLYDLDLQLLWQEKTIGSNSESSCQLNVELKNPDFSSQLFLRWDLQSFLSLQNNLVFPNNFSTYLQVNRSDNSPANADIKFEIPAPLVPSITENSINLDNQSYYQKINFSSHIVYEDKIETVVAKVFINSQLIDEIDRPVFVPSTPVSDTGLTVKIDTLVTSNFPSVELKFHSNIKSNDYMVSNLINDNIFLYEDANRIEDYTLMKDTSGGVNSADIVFVLDVTGSMGGEIDNVKNNLIEFADSLSARGIDYRLGMVTFLDVIENIYPFTKDVQYFKSLVDQQYAHGGDDEPENSLQGLLESTKFPFRENCNRVVIWITDATYHENDLFTPLTKDVVINALLSKGIVVHSIGPTNDKSSYYDPIIIPTGGDFYDIYGNFRDILLAISRFKSSGKYILSYVSPSSQLPGQIKLQIRYAGLGGEAIISPSQLKTISKEKHLSFYPNPFNPQITFEVNKGSFIRGELTIYNLLGQLVKTLPIESGSQRITWNGVNDTGAQISSGLYIVRLVLTDKNESKYFESAKILFLK